jgi:hypothetical protein
MHTEEKHQWNGRIRVDAKGLEPQACAHVKTDDGYVKLRNDLLWFGDLVVQEDNIFVTVYPVKYENKNKGVTFCLTVSVLGVPEDRVMRTYHQITARYCEKARSALWNHEGMAAGFDVPCAFADSIKALASLRTERNSPAIVEFCLESA